MEPAQAMFNEVSISRTLAVDALAGRCAQLAGEIAVRDNRIVELTAQVEKQAKELVELKPKKALKAEAKP